MMDPVQLDQLLTVLRRHGVTEYRDGTLAMAIDRRPLGRSSDDTDEPTPAPLPTSSSAALPADDEDTWDVEPDVR